MLIEFGDKKLEINKWKAKQRKEFVKNLTSGNIDENTLMDCLVYDCIEPKVALSQEEFKYVLSRIRAYTLGEEIDFKFYCDKCKEPHEQKIELKNIFSYNYNKIEEINFSGINIKLGPIKNKEYYNKMIQENYSEADLIDFILRIESINDEEVLSFESTMDFLENLDLDIFDNIIRVWEESKFKVNQIHEVTCPNCGDVQKYDFDDIPEFIPTSWIK